MWGVSFSPNQYPPYPRNGNLSGIPRGSECSGRGKISFSCRESEGNSQAFKSIGILTTIRCSKRHAPKNQWLRSHLLTYLTKTIWTLKLSLEFYVFCNGNSVIDVTEQRWPLVPSTFADNALHNYYTTVFHEGNLCYLTNKHFPAFYRTQKLFIVCRESRHWVQFLWQMNLFN